MRTEEARTYFKELGLSYANITKEDILTLNNMVAEKLERFKITGGESAVGMDLQACKPLAKDIKVLKRTGLQYAFLKVKGSYFDSREAISFQRNGFIGFGGELSSNNVQPILEAFCEWCDSIKPIASKHACEVCEDKGYVWKNDYNDYVECGCMG